MLQFVRIHNQWSPTSEILQIIIPALVNYGMLLKKNVTVQPSEGFLSSMHICCTPSSKIGKVCFKNQKVSSKEAEGSLQRVLGLYINKFLKCYTYGSSFMSSRAVLRSSETSFAVAQ